MLVFIWLYLAVSTGCIFGMAWTASLAMFFGDGKITAEFMRYGEGYIELALFLWCCLSWPVFSYFVVKWSLKHR